MLDLIFVGLLLWALLSGLRRWGHRLFPKARSPEALLIHVAVVLALGSALLLTDAHVLDTLNGLLLLAGLAGVSYWICCALVVSRR